MDTEPLYRSTSDSDIFNAFMREVLDGFPGVWFVTIPDEELILETSKNYYEQACGCWCMLRPTTTESGLVVHWLVRPQFEQITGGSSN